MKRSRSNTYKIYSSLWNLLRTKTDSDTMTTVATTSTASGRSTVWGELWSSHRAGSSSQSVLWLVLKLRRTQSTSGFLFSSVKLTGHMPCKPSSWQAVEEWPRLYHLTSNNRTETQTGSSSKQERDFKKLSRLLSIYKRLPRNLLIHTNK